MFFNMLLLYHFPIKQNYIKNNLNYVIIFYEKQIKTESFYYFLSSSVVERSTVNRLVVGSSPTWGVYNIYA